MGVLLDALCDWDAHPEYARRFVPWSDSMSARWRQKPSKQDDQKEPRLLPTKIDTNDIGEKKK